MVEGSAPTINILTTPQHNDPIPDSNKLTLHNDPILDFVVRLYNYVNTNRKLDLQHFNFPIELEHLSSFNGNVEDFLKTLKHEVEKIFFPKPDLRYNLAQENKTLKSLVDKLISAEEQSGSMESFLMMMFGEEEELDLEFESFQKLTEKIPREDLDDVEQRTIENCYLVLKTLGTGKNIRKWIKETKRQSGTENYNSYFRSFQVNLAAKKVIVKKFVDTFPHQAISNDPNIAFDEIAAKSPKFVETVINTSVINVGDIFHGWSSNSKGSSFSVAAMKESILQKLEEFEEGNVPMAIDTSTHLGYIDGNDVKSYQDVFSEKGRIVNNYFDKHISRLNTLDTGGGSSNILVPWSRQDRNGVEITTYPQININTGPGSVYLSTMINALNGSIYSDKDRSVSGFSTGALLALNFISMQPNLAGKVKLKLNSPAFNSSFNQELSQWFLAVETKVGESLPMLPEQVTSLVANETTQRLAFSENPDLNEIDQVAAILAKNTFGKIHADVSIANSSLVHHGIKRWTAKTKPVCFYKVPDGFKDLPLFDTELVSIAELDTRISNLYPLVTNEKYKSEYEEEFGRLVELRSIIFKNLTPEIEDNLNHYLSNDKHTEREQRVIDVQFQRVLDRSNKLTGVSKDQIKTGLKFLLAEMKKLGHDFGDIFNPDEGLKQIIDRFKEKYMIDLISLIEEISTVISNPNITLFNLLGLPKGCEIDIAKNDHIVDVRNSLGAIIAGNKEIKKVNERTDIRTSRVDTDPKINILKNHNHYNTLLSEFSRLRQRRPVNNKEIVTEQMEPEVTEIQIKKSSMELFWEGLDPITQGSIFRILTNLLSNFSKTIKVREFERLKGTINQKIDTTESEIAQIIEYIIQINPVSPEEKEKMRETIEEIKNEIIIK